jgi:hypothetical protein
MLAKKMVSAAPLLMLVTKKVKTEAGWDFTSINH